MDESRDGGMQSGWPGEWPRPGQGSAATPAPQRGGMLAPTPGPGREQWQATGWPTPGEPHDGPAGEVVSNDPPRASKGITTAVGLVLAGALAGGIGIAAVQHGSSTTTTAAQGFAGTAGSTGGQQAGRGQPSQPGQGFPGGFGRDDDGEQRFVGTVTAVSGSSVTVQTSSGTTTYQVGHDTQVVKDGQAASVSDLTAGDRVLMHVVTTGSTPTVERIIAGPPTQQLGGDLGLPGGDPGGDGPGDGPGQGGGATTGLRT